MKVLFLRNVFGKEGVGMVSQRTGLQFRAMGIEVAYLTCELLGGTFDTGAEDIPLYMLPNKKRFQSKENIRFAIDLIKREGIDVVFVLHAPFFKDANKKELGNCKLVYWNHLYPLWEHYGTIQYMKYEAKWQSKLRYMLFRKFKYEWTNIARRKWKRIYRWQTRFYDRYIVLCEQYRRQMIEVLNLNAQEAKKIVPMINELPALPDNFPTQEREDLVVYVGRLSMNDKRVDNLLKIWALVEPHLPPSWHLEIWGGGAYEAKLKAMATQLGLQRASFCGTTSQPLQVFGRAKVACLTSDIEGFPLVLCEAQSQGAVPISFNSYGAVYDIIGEDKLYGRIAQHGNLQDYANKLIDTCLNQELQTAIRQRLPEKCLEYRPGANASKWCTLFKELGLEL